MANSTTNNVDEWNLSDVEVAHVICSGSRTSSGGSKQVYIAKLMPQISMGKPKPTSVGLNKSCIINDSKCKPAVSAKVSTLNYITAPPRANRNFQHSLLSYGATIEVEVRDKNPDNLYISNKVDPSWDP